MIEESDYKLPEPEQPKSKRKAGPKTLEYLESLPFRPFGMEW